MRLTRLIAIIGATMTIQTKAPVRPKIILARSEAERLSALATQMEQS